ncbi:unnamed protein product [Allacma fusca]|uniref:Uncharacterized protein n=1 Tax=Allacma fusca TaxID=39272 RepID=A0A8J2K8P8_9HEXA|nr:unnamed protein product [Allacma fusca]
MARKKHRKCIQNKKKELHRQKFRFRVSDKNAFLASTIHNRMLPAYFSDALRKTDVIPSKRLVDPTKAMEWLATGPV